MARDMQVLESRGATTRCGRRCRADERRAFAGEGKTGKGEKYKDGKTQGGGAKLKREKKGQPTQRTTGHGRSQSCAHFFSRPNPKTLLCPPKINYPPYSKNETAANKVEPRRSARETQSVLRTVLSRCSQDRWFFGKLFDKRNAIINHYEFLSKRIY